MHGRTDAVGSQQPAVVRMKHDVIVFAHKNFMHLKSLFRAIILLSLIQHSLPIWIHQQGDGILSCWCQESGSQGSFYWSRGSARPALEIWRSGR